MKLVRKSFKKSSLQRQLALFAVIFMLFQLISPVSLIKKQLAKAWTSNLDYSSFIDYVTPPGCGIFTDTVTSSTIRVDWDFSPCSWPAKTTGPSEFVTDWGLDLRLFTGIRNESGYVSEGTQLYRQVFHGYSGTMTFNVTADTDYVFKLIQTEYMPMFNSWMYTQMCSAPDCDLYITGRTKTLSAGNQINAVASPDSGGVVEGVSASYTNGQIATITANPKTNYVFDRWVVDSTNTYYQNPLSLNMVQNYNVTAYFLARYTASSSTTGTGTGTVSGTGTFTQGTTATLVATADPGSVFTGWSGDCTGTSVCVLDMNTNKNAVANFDLIPGPQYAVTVTKTGSGSGSVNSAPSGLGGSVLSAIYNENTEVTLTAYPADGSEFTGWSGDCTGTGTCVLTIDAAKNITANFNKIPSEYELIVSKVGTGIGTITSDGAINNDYLETNISRGEGIVLTATPTTGSVFVGWTGECSGTSTCALTMNSAKKVQAVFNLYEAGDISQPNTVKIINGIGIMFADALPEGETEVTFTVEEKESGSNYPTNHLLKKLYSINAIGGSGMAVEEGFTAHLSIPFEPTPGVASSKYSVMYWNGSDWSTEGIDYVSIDTENGVASFETSHFSDFAVFEAVTPATLFGALPSTGANKILEILQNLVLAFALQVVFMFTLRVARRHSHSGA